MEWRELRLWAAIFGCCALWVVSPWLLELIPPPPRPGPQCNPTMLFPLVGIAGLWFAAPCFVVCFIDARQKRRILRERPE